MGMSLDNPGRRTLDIIETEVVVSLLSLLRFILHGREFLTLGHDNTKCLSELGVKLLYLPFQNLQFAVGGVPSPLSGG